MERGRILCRVEGCKGCCASVFWGSTAKRRRFALKNQRLRSDLETKCAAGSHYSANHGMEHGRGSEFGMEPHHPNSSSSSFTSYSHSMRSGGGGIGGRGMQSKDFIRSRPRGRGNEGSGKDKIEALGRLRTRILRHMASELKLNMRGDGFVKVQDLLKLDMKTFANIPLRSHGIEDIKEAVGKDNKQRFSLVEDGEELWIRANQGHTITTVEAHCFYRRSSCLCTWHVQKELAIDSGAGPQTHATIACTLLMWFANRW